MTAFVSISELKLHWSEWIRQLKAGETIIITRRGRPVAQMEPYTGTSHNSELVGSTLHEDRQIRASKLSSEHQKVDPFS